MSDTGKFRITFKSPVAEQISLACGKKVVPSLDFSIAIVALA